MNWLLPVCIVLAMPFIYLQSTIDPVLTPRYLFLAVTMFIFLAALLLKSMKNNNVIGYSILKDKLLILIGVFILISIIAAIFSYNKSEATFDLSRTMLGFILFLVATLVFINHDNGLRIFSNMTTAAVFILCLIGLCQYYELAFQFMSGGGQLTATMANKNLFMAFLCFSLPFQMISMAENNKLWKAFSILTCMLSLFLILISQTRAIWLAIVFASICCTIIYFVWKYRFNLRTPQKPIRGLRGKLLLSLVMLIIISTGVAFFSDNGIQGSIQRAQSIFNPNQSSNMVRLTLWDNSLKMFSEKPIVGVGPGNWKLIAPKYGPVGRAGLAESRFFQRPHNDYLWMLTETGIPGLLAYLLIMIIIFSYAFKIIFKANDEQRARFTILLLFGLIAYLVDSFFSFPRERIILVSFSMVIMAGIFSIHHGLFGSGRKVSRTNVVTVLSILLLLTAFSSAMGFMRVRAETHTNLALNWRGTGTWHRVIEEIDQAETIFATLDPTATPLSWYRGEAHFMLKDYDEAFTDYQKAMKQHPYNMHVLNNLATCYELRGFHEEAIEYYGQAIAVYPGFDDALINLAAVLYNVGRYAEALEMIQRVSPDCKDERLPLFVQKIFEKTGQ